MSCYEKSVKRLIITFMCDFLTANFRDFVNLFKITGVKVGRMLVIQ